MCGTQLSDRHVNCCALSDIDTIIKDGRVNEGLVSDILGMLTAQRHELETDILPTEEEADLLRKWGDIEC